MRSKAYTGVCIWTRTVSAESMFRAYCAKIGVAFETQMLNWNNEANENSSSVFRQWLPWFEGVLSSSTFQPATTKPHDSPKVVPELPRHVQQAVDDSYAYYRQMHAVRLRPPKLVA